MKESRLIFKMENINAILNVQDMSRSLAFYIEVLGFTNADWGDDLFTSINRDGHSLYLCQGSQGTGSTWVWMGFDGDILVLYQELLQKKVKIKMPPTNFPWAFEMQIYDPDGHVLRFGTDPDENPAFHPLASIQHRKEIYSGLLEGNFHRSMNRLLW